MRSLKERDWTHWTLKMTRKRLLNAEGEKAQMKKPRWWLRLLVWKIMLGSIILSRFDPKATDAPPGGDRGQMGSWLVCRWRCSRFSGRQSSTVQPSKAKAGCSFVSSQPGKTNWSFTSPRGSKTTTTPFMSSSSAPWLNGYTFLVAEFQCCLYVFVWRFHTQMFLALGVQSMRGSKWADAVAPLDATVFALSHDCDGQGAEWFTKSSFIDEVTKLDKKSSGYVAHFRS